MKTFFQLSLITLVATLSMLIMGPSAFAIAPASPITVATGAGGTQVVPQGSANNQLCVTNTGATYTIDCSEGQVPTSTNWNFQLAPLASWCASSARTEPMNIASGLLPSEAITCIAISGTSTATYFKR
jgi:hypothetical protein